MPSYVAICRSLLGSFLCLGLCLAVVFAREDVPKPPVVVKAEATSPAQAKASELDRKILKEIQDNAEVKANLTHLSDVIGSRMTGSENLKKANQWARDKFQAYGLTNVVLEPYEIPAAWERGFVHMKLVEPDNGRLITAASRAWTPGTKGRFVGEVVVVEATKSEELDAYKGRFKNALVMLSPPSTITPISEVGKPRNPNAPRRPPFQGASMAIRQQITEMARVEGAACILSDSGKPHGLLNMTGGWRGPDRAGATEPLPSVFVTHDHYSLLHRLALRQNVPPTKVEIEIQAKTIPGPITVYNTVGEIKGSELPEEFVVIGAHLDSWDLGQGTTDNGTGSSVVLESARALGKLAKQGIRPKRTIRFVLFSGEEQGLYGSKEYVKRHKSEMAKTSMALVHDTGTGRVTEIPLQGFNDAKGILESELAILKELKVEIVVGAQGGTDHLSFNSDGVPGFAFHQDPAEYYLTHHSQSDTLDKARWPDLIQGSQVMSITAMRVANLPGLLPRQRVVPERTSESKGGRKGGEDSKGDPKNESKSKKEAAKP